jgi:AcrR family transcriptional regulator
VYPKVVKPVKGKRTYDASGRQARAQANQRAVISAAGELFLADGYGHTTIAAVAARAGVSPETIYATFGSKAELLHKVWDVTVGGDDEDVVFHERPEPQALLDEPDLRVRLRRQARWSTETASRIAPFLMMVQSAAGSDPAAAAMVEELHRQRYEGIGVMAKAAAATGQLAVSEQECRDVVWSTTDGVLWHRLVLQRGWAQDRFAAWLGNLWVALLVDTPGSKGV